MSPTWRRPYLLVLIMAAYLTIGILYAVFTPAWQTPDEPAHYNYIRYIAEMGHLPVLQMGDYPHQYLEQIKAHRFPPDMPIDPIRYEFHQPPLYYLLAVPFYLAFDGALLPLRLFTLLFGAVLLVIAWFTVWEIFPERSELALGTTAFIAFLPMHVAMTAAVNNDALAELWVGVALWGVVRYLKRGIQNSGALKECGGIWREWRSLVSLGIVIGLGLVTKVAALVILPIAIVTVACYGGRSRQDAVVGSWVRLAAVLAPASLIALPWWIRNTMVYGFPDVYGLIRHDGVVVGQPRTAEWLARLGWNSLLREFVTTTFRSFWGQFGWMGVLLDSRIYLALLILSAVAGLGFVLWLVRAEEQSRLEPFQRTALGLLALSAVLTVLSYLWYNVQFVQHQGRYLFPALVPLALAFALGLEMALRREQAWLMVVFSGVAILIGGFGLAVGGVDKWALALIGAAGLIFVLRALVPARIQWALFPYMALPLLDLWCLFGFIVPALAR